MTVFPPRKTEPAVGELSLPAEAPAPFKRNGLTCYQRVLPWPLDGMPVAVWVAGDERGCVVFRAGPAPMRLPRSTTDINGVPWLGWDIGRHTPRPVSDYDAEYGPSAEPCFYLDNIRCYYDGSSLQAMEMLRRVAAAGSEGAIWDELAAYFKAWISERDNEEG